LIAWTSTPGLLVGVDARVKASRRGAGRGKAAEGSFYAALTEEGSQQLSEARATHAAVIEELFSAKLSAEEMRSLARALGRALEP
jgi:hypothetical protein